MNEAHSDYLTSQNIADKQPRNYMGAAPHLTADQFQLAENIYSHEKNSRFGDAIALLANSLSSKQSIRWAVDVLTSTQIAVESLVNSHIFTSAKNWLNDSENISPSIEMPEQTLPCLDSEICLALAISWSSENNKERADPVTTHMTATTIYSAIMLRIQESTHQNKEELYRQVIQSGIKYL